MRILQLVCVIAIVAGLATTTSAQITKDKICVGGPGTWGCQDSNDPPLLSNGDRASAKVDYIYDSSLGVLTLIVTNTSSTVTNAVPAVITDISFNVPGGVTGLSLMSQTQGSGSLAPAFVFSFALNKVGCFGDFDAELAGAVQGGIGNANATSFPNALTVLGPVTFVFKVTAADPGAYAASSFVNSVSTGGSHNVPAAIKFQGSNQAGSGFLGGCPNALSIDLGGGCGTPTAPVMKLTVPTVGSTALLSIQSQFKNAPLFLFVSPGEVTPIPYGPCTLHLNPAFFYLFAFSTDGNGAFNLKLPFSRGNAGICITVQAYIFGTTFTGDHITNGIYFRVGCPSCP